MEKYQEVAFEWLETLKTEGEFFRKKETEPSTKTTHEFLDFLGRPEKYFQHRVIVGGSAGKGSVCRYTEQTLLAQNKKVAVLLSPHLQVLTERIRINGRLIDSETFGKTILEIKAVSQKIGKNPTFYEAVVLTGILAAKNSGCEILIAEVGCGGEFDAVNAIKGSRISALTFVGHDHFDLFGKNLEKTAYIKAGIFETDDLIAAFSYEKKYREILDSRSQIPIKYITGVLSKCNKKLAREVCKTVLKMTNGECRIANIENFEMVKPKIPCRWEWMGEAWRMSNNECRMSNKKNFEKNFFTSHYPLSTIHLILDGAHSKERFEYILPKIKKISGKKVTILGMNKRGNLADLCILAPYFDKIFLTTNQTESESRKLAENTELQKIIPQGILTQNPKKALELALREESVILVTGSLYLCAEVRNFFYSPQKILDQCDEFPLENKII